MKKRWFLASLAMSLLCTGCYGPITGKIVDAETGKPIEGAVVLVEWTKTRGFGLTYHTSEKVAQRFSDKEGVVKLPGCRDPFADKPDLTVYKPGYVAWNNHWIFPGRSPRQDFRWESNYVFKLERFSDGYSYAEHESFVALCTNTGFRDAEKEAFWRLFTENEQKKVLEEQRKSKEGGAK